MAIAKRHPRVQAVSRAAALDHFPGEWVAIKDGQVLAHSTSSREVVRQMKRLGPTAAGAVLQRSATPTEALAVGLG